MAATIRCLNNSGNTIGETGENTLLSDVITSLSLHPYFDEVNLCVEGTLVINTNYNFSNSTFLMKPGARILIQEEKALSLGNSLLMGCDKMWRGIELEKNADIKMSGCTVLDAQYALYVHPAGNALEAAGGTVVSNTFGNNFVGLLIPPIPTGTANVALGDNFYYQSGVNLKPTYPSQMSLSPLPNQGTHTLAGIIVNNQAGFGSYRNRFTGLTAGIVANRTGLIVKENRFTGIQPHTGEYTNFIGRGMGVRSDANGAGTTMVNASRFTDCFVGISANLTALTATWNTLTDVYGGIFASLPMANNANIVIEDNTIEDATFVGIMVGHANPGADMSISRNKVSTDAEENGVGIWLFSNNAEAEIHDNIPITVKGTGVGIGMYVSNQAELKNNVINLENTDMARSGIALTFTQRTALRTNTVQGAGTTGDANENIGIEIASSPGNAYCCNTLNNTRLGVSVFGGSLTTDQFRGTNFGEHATSLYLPNTNSILGIQKHTQNCWENGGEAIYNVPSDVAEAYVFTVDYGANNCFLPTLHSPSEWFENEVNPTGTVEDICATAICKIDGFKPSSDDVKHIANADTSLLPAVRWELHRYIYEKLLTEGLQDSLGKFWENTENTTIDFFQTINEGIAALFTADEVSRTALKDNLILATEKLDSLVLVDSLIILEDDSTTIAGLMETRGEIADELFDLTSDSEDLAETIADNFSDAADDLRAINDTITVTEDFEINEKIVNDLYLAYLAEGDTSGMDTLEAIAAQCPLLGGNAVYRARALLALITGELVVYNDSLNCISVLPLARPARHTIVSMGQAPTVYPNPTGKEVTVAWPQAIQKTGSLKLYDIYGRQLLALTLGEGEMARTIVLPDLPESVYVLQIRLDGFDFVKKLAIKH